MKKFVRIKKIVGMLASLVVLNLWISVDQVNGGNELDAIISSTKISVEVSRALLWSGRATAHVTTYNRPYYAASSSTASQREEDYDNQRYRNTSETQNDNADKSTEQNQTQENQPEQTEEESVQGNSTESAGERMDASGNATVEEKPVSQTKKTTTKGNAQMGEARLNFIRGNMSSIQQEVATGYGSSLDVLAALYFCQRGDIVRFQHMLHENYFGLYEEPTTPENIQKRLGNFLSTNQREMPTCKN